jgi:hypothetical protein
MLRRLQLENFTVFAEANLSFGALNVIHGENGLGKTHLLKLGYSVASGLVVAPNASAPDRPTTRAVGSGSVFRGARPFGSTSSTTWVEGVLDPGPGQFEPVARSASRQGTRQTPAERSCRRTRGGRHNATVRDKLFQFANSIVYIEPDLLDRPASRR